MKVFDKDTADYNNALSTGRVIKDTIIPKPTSAAVNGGDNSARIARAPAEIMGGIPASKTDTLAAKLSNPSPRQTARAISGAIISLIAKPIPNGCHTSELNLSFS